MSAFSKAELRFSILFEVPPVLLRHCNSLSDCYWTSVNTTWLTASLMQDCMGYAEPTPTFFYLIPILRRFRIIRRNQQAALHSALFKFTPLVISGDWQKYAANIIKPTQTGINREKSSFCIIKSSNPQKNLKTSCVPYLGLDLSIFVIKSQIHLVRQSL